ncbi:sulfotransferase family protein [Flavobacterium sp.]|uniref:sulfotransferase family protein n=1 Tax=Flavobacterium sp. TaxID=239 RepID=UPI003918EEE3
MNFITFKQKVYSRYRKSKWVSAIFSFFGKELQPKKWVFIIGCYNSGTTLLTEIFEKNNQLCVLPDEGVMLTNQLPRPEDYGWQRMWSQCEEKMKIDINNASEVARITKRHWSHFVKGNPTIVVEKSIANAARMSFFQEHFPNSYFIYIVRNGYAVAEGIKRKAIVMKENQPILGNKYPIDYTAKQWQSSINIVERERESINNFLEISYEEMTADLKGTCLKVTNFLEINPFDDNSLQGDFEVHGNKMKVSNQNHKSFARLSEEEWHTINTIAEKGLKNYSYYTEKPIL